ncbi:MULTISPECIES: acetyl-CoA carboxylase biotin carboxyl carrier protein subunit [Bacillaceae]|uniref:Acetyl-CoA carboxylase n=1 Tax=Oceanobacillus caeni TaxID=405946 RepID=A0ABR5MN57_9BACI|nr:MULTISPECIES: acetyl-CoA carboxylase biotin carboxyl carrier protein subunit [Bacillaceae]KKE79801.1 acetyl-CoA carboxylase [Bacilli bacterium VT-13-104]PZD89485.1 acetyl-CoA carboxylase biotin carboxyl carrier protein subunit [Bacilli bacterium]KPH78475.1 acetyl-CoA carboxylase [Oceanobacillus caeni]MBU8789284.1 acetyl-CoA carboxylase biotin carboxyl carrier protein subunit [Oceanobacillus caeni]MED4474086.1 acetyl-CoA carboxylase biotin carboxyl carrier protein subunit [Oceanobacillus cae
MEIKANLAGVVWQVLVSHGEEIIENQDVVILESMKMEIPIESEKSGKVKEVKVKEGDFVNEGDVLMVVV